ncbi:MAG TPA: hypothetical protein VFC03_18365 [Acidimicrobiales bacterium]|nr:hypothetical protein [Acidimicrobiales bacterium]
MAIRVLLDHAYSGASVNRAAHAQLEAAGVPVRWVPDAVIFHQKTVTVDGAVSAVMTGNLTAQHYGTTRDFPRDGPRSHRCGRRRSGFRP